MSSVCRSAKQDVISPNLLVSARSMLESEMIIRMGASWLDLKEPSRGSLGRPDVALIDELARMDIPSSVEVSIAGGELADWTSDLDASLAARLPERFYLKLALSECQGSKWQSTAERISHALSDPSQLILVHYADAVQANAPEWAEVLQAAFALGGQYVLVDTFDKRSGSLLDHCSLEQLRSMIQQARGLGLGVALAGSIQLSQLESLSKLGAQWLGVRGAICKGTQRTMAICSERLQQALTLVSTYSRNES